MAKHEDYWALIDVLRLSKDLLYQDVNPDYYLPHSSYFCFERSISGFKYWLFCLRQKDVISESDAQSFWELFLKKEISFRGYFYSPPC